MRDKIRERCIEVRYERWCPSAVMLVCDVLAQSCRIQIFVFIADADRVQQKPSPDSEREKERT